MQWMGKWMNYQGMKKCKGILRNDGMKLRIGLLQLFWDLLYGTQSSLYFTQCVCVSANLALSPYNMYTENTKGQDSISSSEAFWKCFLWYLQEKIHIFYIIL